MTDYLLVYTTKNEFYQNENDTTDHYEAFLDDKEEAEKRYKEECFSMCTYSIRSIRNKYRL